MNCKEILYKSVDTILKLNNFDIVSYTYNYKRYAEEMLFFHNKLGKSAKSIEELSHVKYDIPKYKRPQVRQIAYFYIPNGYPKEIFNSHWCLILRDFGNTMTVIPLTSIKEDSRPVDRDSEMIIKVKGFDSCSKLKIHQIISADTLRIDRLRPIYDLQTDYSYVISNVIKILQIG